MMRPSSVRRESNNHHYNAVSISDHYRRSPSTLSEVTDDSTVVDVDNPPVNVKGHNNSGITELKATNVKIWEIIMLTCFNFLYGLICGTMGLFILPAESIHLYPRTASVTLGISLLVVGFSQLVCPIAGRASDVHPATTPVRRRRPFLLYGASCGFVSVIGMWLTSVFRLGVPYYIFLLTGMLGLNVVYSVQCGLVPDLLEEDIQGTSSGIVAVHTVTGSGIGFALMIATTTWDFHLVYPLYMLLIIVTTSLSLWSAARLQSRLSMPLHKTKTNTHDATVRSVSMSYSDGIEMTDPAAPVAITSQHEEGKKLLNLSWKDIVEAFAIDTSQNMDFFYVFLGRTFYYIGVSVQAFILFFLRDVVGTTDESERRRQIASIALLAQTCAASIAYPMGKLSDNVKVGKKVLIYVACLCMSIVYLCFLISPLFGKWAFTFVLASAALYGAGNGCFLSVDYGLALETLPDKSKSAQALGIWGVSAFIGSAVGPLIWGALIEFFGGNSSAAGFGALLGVGKLPESQSHEHQYAYTGYEAMLLGGMAATAAAGIMIRFVKAGGRGAAVVMEQIGAGDGFGLDRVPSTPTGLSPRDRLPKELTSYNSPDSIC